MHRLSTVLRRLRHVGAPDLRVGHSSVVGVSDLLNSLRSRSASGAAGDHPALVCACILERLPIVMPPPPAWETEYEVCFLRHPQPPLLTVFAGLAIREEACDLQGVSAGEPGCGCAQTHDLCSLQELIEPKTAEDTETKQSWTPSLPADLPSDMRCVPGFLVLRKISLTAS